MSYKRILPLILVLFFFACSTGQQLTQYTTEANNAFDAGDHQKAFSIYEKIISERREKNQLVGGEVYNHAGLSAWALGDTAKAMEYLDAARHTEAASSQTFQTLAIAYRQIDNLSREITNLELLRECFPDSQESQAMTPRLFLTYVESMNWDLALDLWPSLDEDVRKQEDMLDGYFLVHKNLGNESESDKLATQLHRINNNNVNALQWLGEKYYHRAEQRYQTETRAYDQNRTHRQYALLLEGYKVMNEDFRTSLNYLLKLYSLNPTPSAAQLIGNIYMRFEDREKAAHYHRLARQ